MNQDQFSAMLAIIIPPIIDQIVKNSNIDEPMIIRRRHKKMSKEAGFLIYCMERYRHFKGLSGSEVADLFESCKVDEYIMKYFESLHTMGEQYIIKDIDDYIAEMKKEN